MTRSNPVPPFAYQTQIDPPCPLKAHIDQIIEASLSAHSTAQGQPLGMKLQFREIPTFHPQ